MEKKYSMKNKAEEMGRKSLSRNLRNRSQHSDIRNSYVVCQFYMSACMFGKHLEPRFCKSSGSLSQSCNLSEV